MRPQFVLYVIMMFLATSLFGQNNVKSINGFKYAYVVIASYGANNQQDIYGITQYLRDRLSNKGLIVLDYNPNIWPQEAKNNPCLIGTWNPTNESGAFYTAKAGYTVKNCKNETVYQNFSKASRIGNYYPANVKVAMEKAYEPIEKLKYSFDENLTSKIEFPPVETTTETEQSIKKYLDNNKLDALEGIYKSYQNETLGYYKFAIIKTGDSYKAIIIESGLAQWKQGEVKAYFETSSMRGIFSVKWFLGNKTSTETFATLDNDAILSLEGKNLASGEKIVSKFVKVYPSISGNTSIKSDQPKASGSGFFISTNGIIATNAHVIEDASKIEVIVSNELGTYTYKAKILLNDGKNDVALIQIADTTFKGLTPLPYSLNETADVGEKVFTIGYPLNNIMGSNYKVTDGIISSKSGIADDLRYYQISVPLQPGNSGGPLFDKNGSVIGITSAKLNGQAVGTSIENVNYAIKVSYLLSLYGMLPNPSKLPTSSKLVGEELQQQVKTLKNFVCLIRIY